MSTTSATKQFVFGDVGHCIAFGLGLGFAPRMPGTIGTLGAFPLYWLSVLFLPLVLHYIVAALLFALGVWLCGRCQQMLKTKDDSGIVLDEIAAFYFVLVIVADITVDHANMILWQIAAFILFRFFDAAKPPPIGWLDKNIDGGWGIMIDDMAAAFVCVLILYTVTKFL